MLDFEKSSSVEKVDAEKQVHVGEVEENGSSNDVEVNASGHRDQLTRQYGTLSICATAVTIDNAWVAFGGSITTAIYNGGPPGILYELIAACCYYGFIAASLAELASSIPSAGGVYHWASVTPGPRWGRSLGFLTGLLNFYAWIFGITSIAFVFGEVTVQMWALFHPDYVIQTWHVFVSVALVNVLSCALVMFGNGLQPLLQKCGIVVVVGGGLTTIIVLAAMPKEHASNAFVWTDWVNATGWSSGTAFLTGMLNGSFAIGTPDSVTHMAEELPHPRKDLPKAIAAQMIVGTLDLDAVINSSASFPLAEAYIQGTGNKGAAFGLLLIIALAIFCGLQGVYITCGRVLWALARDNVIPFSGTFSQVNTRLSCPIPATILVFFLSVGIAAIALGSETAFSNLASSFCVISTVSYLIPIAGHLFTGRRNIPRGPFWMGKYGFFVNGAAVLLIVFMNIMYCLPYSLPTTVETMNYNSVIFVGFVVVTAVLWLVHGWKKYEGPKLPHLDEAGRVLEDEK